VYGFAAITAKNGREGVETAVAERPNLILDELFDSDELYEARVDGWEATRVSRANPQTKEIPDPRVNRTVPSSDLKTWIDVRCNNYITSHLRQTNS
jgi:CheY-like chemotaxis protein